MAPSEYQCPRCGYATDRHNNYAIHLRRKTRCKPKLGDVQPTLENVLRSRQPAAGSPQVTNTNTSHLSLGSNLGTVNITNNTTTTIHNHINVSVLPFRAEDLSHITQAQWRSFAERMAAGKGHDAVLEMLSLINYNPDKPENMNMYFPPPDKADGQVLYLNCRTRTWKWLDRAEAVQWLAEAKAEHVQDHVDEHRRIFRKEERQLVDEYVDRARTEFATDQVLIQAVDSIATCGSRFMLVQHRDVLESEYARVGKTLRCREE